MLGLGLGLVSVVGLESRLPDMEGVKFYVWFQTCYHSLFMRRLTFFDFFILPIFYL